MKQNYKDCFNFESNIKLSDINDINRLPINLKGEHKNYLSMDELNTKSDYRLKNSNLKQLPHGNIEEEMLRKASISNNFDLDLDVDDEYNTLRPKEINLLNMKRKSSIKSVDTSSSIPRYESIYIDKGIKSNRSFKCNDSVNFEYSEKSFCNYDFFENLNKNYSTYSVNNDNNIENDSKKLSLNKPEKSVDDNWSLSLTDNN